MNVLFNHIVAITSQYICASNHQIVHFKLIIYQLYLNKGTKIFFFFLRIQLSTPASLTQCSPVAQMVKNLHAVWETRVWHLDQEDPLEKGTTTHSSILTWRIPWTENPDGLQSMKSQSQTWLSELHIHFLILIIWLQHHLINETDRKLFMCVWEFFKGIYNTHFI